MLDDFRSCLMQSDDVVEVLAELCQCGQIAERRGTAALALRHSYLNLHLRLRRTRATTLP